MLSFISISPFHLTELNKRLCSRDNKNSFGGYISQLCGAQAVWRGEEEAPTHRGQVQRHEPRGHHEGHRHGGDGHLNMSTDKPLDLSVKPRSLAKKNKLF